MSAEQSDQLFQQAGQLFQQGQYEQALNILGQLNQAHPNSAKILMPAVQCMEKLGRTQEALPLCQQLIQLQHPQAQEMYQRMSGQAAAPPPVPQQNAGGIPGLEGVGGLDLGDMGDIGSIGGLDTMDMGDVGGLGGLDSLDMGGNGGAAPAPKTEYKVRPEWQPWSIAIGVTVVYLILLYFVNGALQKQSMALLAEMGQMVPTDPTGQMSDADAQNMMTDFLGSFLQNGPTIMLLSLVSSALAGFIPGVLGLWCALKVVSKLPVEDWWDDIQHIAVTEGICTLVSMTVIGFLAIPFILIKRYELTCGGVLPVFSLYVIISWVGSFAINTVVGRFPA